MTMLFSLREHKVYAVQNPDYTFSKSGASVVRVTTTDPSYGDGYIFRSFPRSWLNGKKIKVKWKGEYFIAPFTTWLRVYDGEYVRSSDVDFPSGSGLPTKGNGLLVEVRLKTGNFDETYTSGVLDLSGGSEDKCTLFMGTHDAWAWHGWFEVDYLQILDASDAVLCSEDFTDNVHMEVTGTFGDYGYISEGECPVLECEDYTTEEDCLAADCYWYNGSCHSEEATCEDYDNEPECTAAGCYWYDGACHSTPPPPPPGRSLIEVRLSDVDPPAPDPPRTIYRDLFNLPDPVELGITIRYFNYDDIQLWLRITGEAPGYTFDTVNLGALASGTSAYRNLDEFASRAKPDAEVTEHIKLILRGYSDAGYTNLRWTFERTVTVVWVDDSDPSYTTDMLNNFDDGTVQGWGGYDEEDSAPFTPSLCTDFVLSPQYSLCLSKGSGVNQRQRFEKSITTPNRNIVYAIIDLRVHTTDVPLLNLKNIRVRYDTVTLVFIGRPYDTVEEQYIPDAKWMRIVVPLPKNTTLNLQIRLQSYRILGSHWMWMDDFKVISKD